MPKARRWPDNGIEDDDNGGATGSIDRASEHLIEARSEADAAKATSLRMFIDMALVEAGILLARLGVRSRDGH